MEGESPHSQPQCLSNHPSWCSWDITIHKPLLIIREDYTPGSTLLQLKIIPPHTWPGCGSSTLCPTLVGLGTQPGVMGVTGGRGAPPREGALPAVTGVPTPWTEVHSFFSSRGVTSCPSCGKSPPSVFRSQAPRTCPHEGGLGGWRPGPGAKHRELGTRSPWPETEAELWAGAGPAPVGGMQGLVSCEADT